MKIKTITLNNITSFRGKHQVDFQEMATRSDLFAITGPTGAGKSTLLNAMAMAIFSDNIKGLSAPDLVTMGEQSGSISLEIIINGSTYRIEWNCQVLKKDGTPRAKPISNSRLYKDDELIEQKLSNILNLDFNQFNQVIVLNQGKFSEFLTSTFSERKNILEGLLGHKELKDLGKKVRSKKNKLENEIKSLKDQSEQAQLLTSTELDSIKIKLESSESNQKNTKNKYRITKELSSLLKETINLVQKELNTKEKINEQQNKAKAIEIELDLFTNSYRDEEKGHNTLKNEFKKQKPILEAARNNLLQREKIGTGLSSLQKQSNEITYKVKKNNDFLTNQQEELKKLHIQKQEKLELLKKYRTPDLTGLTILRDQILAIKEIESKLTIHSESLELAKKTKKDIEDRGKSYQTKKEALADALKVFLNLKEELKELEFDVIAKNTKNYSNKFYQENQLYNQLKEKHLILTNSLESTTSSLTEYEVKNKKLDLDITTTTQSIQEFIKKLKTNEELKSENSKKLANQELLLSAREIITEKTMANIDVDSIECPICNTSQNEEQWLQRFEQIISTDIDSLQEEGQELQRKIEALMLKKNKADATLKLLKSSKTEHCEKMNELIKTSKSLNNEISEIAEKLKTQRGSSNKHLQAKQEVLNSITQLADEIATERQQWSKNEEILRATKDIITKLVTQRSTLQENIQNSGLLEINLNCISNTIETINEDIRTLHAIDKIVVGVERVNVTIEKSKRDQAENSTKLQEISNEVLNYNQELTKLENEKTANSFPDDPVKEYEAWETKIESVAKSLEKLRYSKNEKQNDFDKNLSQINLLKEQNIEIVNLENLYLEKLTTSIKELQKLKLAESDQVLEKLKEHTGPQITLESFRENLVLWSEFLNDHIIPYCDKLEVKISENVEEISRYSTQIQQNEIQNKKIVSLLNERKSLVCKLEELMNLEFYVGKDQFRDFTLAVLEQNLLKVANKEIESLADGRYKLIHAKAGKRSEFLVQDFWQGGLKRKVSTLSGGETFLLSLGLSLGLSEITRGQTEIDCFFIDEGFGTLDSECIEQVLNCLMALQSRGKQIGLISHVKGLTDQIPVRLELSKNNFGESSLSLQ